MIYDFTWCPATVWEGPGIVLALAVICVVWTLLGGWRTLRITGFKRGEPEVELDEVTGPDCLVSVIAYASDIEGLDEFLEGMARQDMPRMEVIVVTDAGPETTSALAERYAGHKDLYFTFLPAESRNVSRLKLAYTLGIKAARGEAVLTTASSVTVPSGSWVRRMAAPVMTDDSVDVVLGYARTDLTPLRATKWWREFDTLVTSAQWIGSALDGKPYRGDRRNLLFRRRLFFDHDGYSATNPLQTGDDDIFISAISTPANTRIVLDPEAQVSESWGEATGRVWTHARQRYAFTSKWLTRAPFRVVGAAQLMQWIVPLLCVGTALWGWFGYGEWWPGAAALGALLAMWGVEIVWYRRASARLGATRLWWSVIPFMMWRPIAGFLFNLNHRRERVANYTWQR